MGVYTNDNALREKVVWEAKGRRLSEENFDGENLDELIKICQICQYFPCQNFMPYSISVVVTFWSVCANPITNYDFLSQLIL